MTSQQLADQLKAQWDLLWWAKPADRLRIIDETREDLTYESLLRVIGELMSEPWDHRTTSVSSTWERSSEIGGFAT